MSNSPVVSRTAPIAIAPKPAAPHVSAASSASLSGSTNLRQKYQQEGGSGRFDLSRGSMSSVDASAPHSLASTPSGPCDSCRRLHLKCTTMSDDEDACVPCQRNGSECSLVLSPQPRKRKLNREATDNGFVKRSSPIRADNRRRRAPNSTISSPAASSSFLEDMANVGGPTLMKRTLGMQNDRYSQYIGPTTDFEPSLINLSPFNPEDESLLARGTLRRVGPDDTFLMLLDSDTAGYEHVLQDVDEIEKIVAPHGRSLIDLYFSVVHPAFPIIQKGVFLEKYDRSYREFSPPLLAAIYLLAINWWHHSADLAQYPKPDVAALEDLVRSTLDDAMHRPKLSTIQAGLLLSQRPDGDQWAPTAQLVAIGQELGLHLDCTAWKIPPWEKGLRKRLAWGLYMQDKWGALVHGRPSHIFPSNWAVQPLAEKDFPDVDWDEEDMEEKKEVETGRLVFLCMMRLTKILAEILDTFFTIQAQQAVTNAGSQGTQMVLSLAKPIQLKLKEWFSGLPTAIRMDSSYSVKGVPGGRLSSIGFLHLAYFATEITLHRRIIRSLASASAPAADSYLQHICRNAAKARLISAMDFVNRLSPNHLQAFWYFASKTNFALIGTFGSLLWATSPGKEESEWYRRRLGEYRWTLSVSSKQGEGKGLTAFAMTMLDISTGLLKKLPEKPDLSRSASSSDVMGMNSMAPPLSMSGPPMSRGQDWFSSEGFSGLPSAEVSEAVSPRSLSDSSDDEMYGN
ncbi:related to DAL81 - transcriptional activator for allantoin and GABA catabolic genes [Cephalotrichum gorgonifer]|uniref:Related to DAL81 - transcriptional activator for allantoin and GABA catabolic genes n=1 Tax=Cephalotrichum gorgonifer TaxID=2041049 RepID=A0AAE8N267_9PEZI|nr:related to DAL81 - transcriptional activator for allantoin and GABA catabolic genes [Cephalotrichum gorgonifer]